MRALFFICMAVAGNKLAGQEIIETKQIFYEDFSGITDFIRLDESRYSTEVVDGRFQCFLNLQQDWNWTWIGLPSELSHAFNWSDNVKLSFDVDVSNIDSFFQVGLLFDHHNVSNDCLGGDFYEIRLRGDASDDYLLTNFWQTANCNSDVKFEKKGATLSYQDTFTVSIKKLGMAWVIYINDEKTLELNVSGSISLDRLLFGKGLYFFDNFKVEADAIILEEHVQSGESLPTTTDPRIFALCVGIEDYSNYPGYSDNLIDNLNYTVDDAKAYHAFLQSAAGGSIPEAQLKFLPNRQATREAILTEASTLFDQAGPNDMVILFLSGHGGNGYFCASDTELPYAELNEIIRNSAAKNKLCLVDACKSGSFKDKNVFRSRGQRVSEAEAKRLYLEALSRAGSGITYLLASNFNQNSWESPSFGHGVFTHYLLSALRCDSNEIAGPVLTAGDIYSYLEKYVSRWHIGRVDEHNNPLTAQNPLLHGNNSIPVSVCTN